MTAGQDSTARPTWMRRILGPGAQREHLTKNTYSGAAGHVRVPFGDGACATSKTANVHHCWCTTNRHDSIICHCKSLARRLQSYSGEFCDGQYVQRLQTSSTAVAAAAGTGRSTTSPLLNVQSNICNSYTNVTFQWHPWLSIGSAGVAD